MDAPYYSGPNQDGVKSGNHQPSATQRDGLDPTSDGRHMGDGRPSIPTNSPNDDDQNSKEKHPKEGYDGTSGRNDKDGQGSGGGELDGPRYPCLETDYRPPRRFQCPFHKHTPARFSSCGPSRFTSISYVEQHIGRRHLLREAVLGLPTGVRPDTVLEPITTHRPEHINVYCKWCRNEFQGPGAERRLYDHTMGCEARNEPATIEQTGVLLPEEFEELRSSVSEVPGPIAKWSAIWGKCFPSTEIPPPYVDTVVSQGQAQLILQQLLALSAAEPWSSAETRQSWIEKALSAIYSGSPFTAGEPQVNDASTVRSALLSNTSQYEESTFDNQNDGLSTAPESCVDLSDINPWIRPLKTAILDVDHARVHDTLRNSFDKVAVGEYSWLLELKALGLSMDEIADELLERAQYGPWIYSKINVPSVEDYQHGFHLPRCLHSWKEDETMPTALWQPGPPFVSHEADSKSSVRETIEYLCGIGGVGPVSDGSPNLQFGSVVFEGANSTAIVSLINIQSFQVVENVTGRLRRAISTLQQAGGCCDSFTFLKRQVDLVELQRIEPARMSGLEGLISGANSEASLENLDAQLLSSLTAQFLSLAFALYAQGHCEPFRPFFLDTHLQRILLIGNQIWGPSFTGPCILVSPVELSCFGEMVQRRVFAFEYFDSFERSKVFSDCDKQFDLKALPEDLLDTWGPGNFIIPKDDSANLHAISIGGGLITSTSKGNSQAPVLHWNPLSTVNTQFASTFPRNEKLVVGSRVLINQTCTVAPQERIKMAFYSLQELGTYPSYWEVSERHLGGGLQFGQGAVGLLNFAQTYVKRLGQTRKSNILANRSLSIADLEGLFAVQVSFCTGIARRVRLRELLADVLPIFVADLATQPRYWKELQDCNIQQILRADNFRERFKNLKHELQEEFETLAFAVLFLLQDTGVDRQCGYFVVGCISADMPAQCFRIPIQRQSFWTQILADSEEVATFAYVAAKCYERGPVTCRGRTEPWVNTTALFWTAVSLCQDQPVTKGMATAMTNWSLQDSESYHIGRADRPLVVRVLRPSIQDEPELLVSMSRIEGPLLNSLGRKMRYNRRCRLRESRAIDHQYQMAESVVVTADF
ncbi:ankyrin 3 [Fusarium coicis]|nr:ankyrin 3 [Fusarium coicis]